ncbi:hypothetical protein PanWU01x14_239790, partial [Parasponia andersonii]
NFQLLTNLKLKRRKKTIESSPNDLPNVLRRHIFLLGLDETKLPLITISLRVKLLPFPGLLLELGLGFRRRWQDRIRGLGGWRRRNDGAASSRRHNLAGVPHGGDTTNLSLSHSLDTGF